MLYGRRPWEEELEIVDRVMKRVSDITEPEEMVSEYWNGIAELIPTEDFLALSRRNVEPPEYLITRSSRFTEHFNPWEERHRLPRLSGGVLGEIAYADRPIVIDDLPARLRVDDPAHFYLEGFQSLIAFPQYERGKGVNIGISLFPPGVEFDRASVPIMHWLASLFGRGTQSLVLRKQLTAALAALDRELAVVGEIQRSLLPQAMPEIPGIELATSYATSARAGGDYYDFFPVARADGGTNWGFFVADVSGHGTPAAVLMAITHAIAHTRPGEPMPPGQLLAYVNSHLARSYTTGGNFVTAFYGVLDPSTRELTYAVAGHNPPIVLRGDRVEHLDGDAGLPLGLVPNERYGDATFRFERGDLALFYTDGITEAPRGGRAPNELEQFGEGRMIDAARRPGNGCNAESCARAIDDALFDFTLGESPADDRTLVVMRVD